MIFEIGSITKVFTALLLADMLQRAEVKLYDPVAKYLPEEVVVPQRGGRESHWRIWQHIRQACRECPIALPHQASRIHMSIIPSNSFINFFRAIS